MDSDRNSNRFLGFRRVKSLPLMDRSGFLAMLLLLFIIADVSNASILRMHRFLISDPPKVDSDGSTLSGKDTPVASPPPPPSKPDPKLVNDGMNKTVTTAPPAKTPHPNLDAKASDNSTKSGSVGTPTDIDGKKIDTIPAIPEHKPKENPTPEKPKKYPTPDPEQKPKENPTPEKPKKNPTPDPEQKPKENPTPEKPKKNPTPDPEQKPKENPTPEKPKKNPTPDPEQKPKENPTSDTEQKPKENPTPDPEQKPEGGKEKTPDVEKTKINNETVTNVPNVGKESCNGVINTCSNLDMVACIKSSNEESTEAVILVQNLRDSILNGTISAEDTRPLEIPKHKYEKIKLNVGKSNKIIVKAGNGECVLQMDPFVSEGNFFIRFPSYEKVVTRINGAYFMIGTVIIFGGMWVCCLIRRRKQHTGGGVPYQELEMAVPESASATDVVTAEGWDQGWDDDWDDNAVKSPVGHLAGSISANGLTARSSNKDGWENNWDD